MKTYPYQDGDKLIQLVEKRELDQLLERLSDARESHLHASSRDMQTIQKQAILLERLAEALTICHLQSKWLSNEDNYREPSFDPCEFAEEIKSQATSALAAYESANLEPVANPIDEVVKRMEAVPVDDLRDEYMDTINDEIHSFEDRDKPFTTEDLVNAALESVRARLIQAARGEQL